MYNIYDWKWQLSNSITNAKQLADHLSLSSEEAKMITVVSQKYRMRITPYYLKLITKPYDTCPIFRQAVPTPYELECFSDLETDPLAEEKYMPKPRIIHKYPDRVVLLVTNNCFMYCRHCTRKNTVISSEHFSHTAVLDKALSYINSHIEIRDVLISGGDPLFFDDTVLEQILQRIRNIQHVETIRIGTRAPVVLPMRITSELSKMLRRYVVWVNTHFNHPKEITPQATQACSKLLDNGIPVGNQTVLLHGINDSTEIIRQLMTNLIKIRVRPYYLYQCDYTQGTAHFITPVTTGIDIIQSLRGNISGYAIPNYVIDCPGDGGKIVIEPNNVVEMNSKELILHNFKGMNVSYSLFNN